MTPEGAPPRRFPLLAAMIPVVVLTTLAPGFVEGCNQGRAEADARFGRSMAKRLETRMKMGDDAFLTRRDALGKDDPASLALVRRTRESLVREIGPLRRVEFLRMRESHLARYGPGERSVDAELRAVGERGSRDLRVKMVREPVPGGKPHWGAIRMDPLTSRS